MVSNRPLSYACWEADGIIPPIDPNPPGTETMTVPPSTRKGHAISVRRQSRQRLCCDEGGGCPSGQTEGETTTSYTTIYEYDANNRLVSEVSNKTGENVLVSYTYDGNGNLLSQLDVNSTAAVHHSYNGFNQLVSSVTGEGTITYTYNAQGIRTSRTVGVLTTHYLLDGGNVIGEVEGDETYTYVRGVNLIFGRARYYLYNAHGDVVQLTNTNGILTKNYNYDAFGNERSPDEEDTNPFRYCGEYYDTETSLYYLRARYYDPLIGRFTQEDTHWNTANMIYGDNPQKINEREDKLGLKHYSYAPQLSAVMQSGNLYAYTANNPILYSDPTGDSIILTCIVVGAILGIAAGGLIGHGWATKKGYSSSDGWDYWQYVAGCGIVGGVIGGLAGWAFSGTAAATAMSWAYYKATTTIGASAYAIGRAFEKWFYKAYNIVNQQISYAGYRLDAIHQSHIIELKNYTWSNYTNLSGLISRFTTQAANYLNIIGRNIAGQTIEGVVFYFSSQPPEKIIKALESLGVIVKWIP